MRGELSSSCWVFLLGGGRIYTELLLSMKSLTDSCLEAQCPAARLLHTVMIHIESGILTSFGISYPQPW